MVRVGEVLSCFVTCCLFLVLAASEACSYRFRSSVQRAKLPYLYEGRYTEELAERCTRLTDAKKRQYQHDFEVWAATNLENKSVGTATNAGATMTSVVDAVLTITEQRSFAAAEYNELLSQAGALSSTP